MVAEILDLDLFYPRARAQQDLCYVAASLIAVRSVTHLAVEDGRKRMSDAHAHVWPLVRPLRCVYARTQTPLNRLAICGQHEQARNRRSLRDVCGVRQRGDEHKRVRQRVREGHGLSCPRLDLCARFSE